MKTPRMLAGFVAVALLAGARCRAQEKPDSQPITPVKVTVVFSEYEGEKKISSLPYILAVNAMIRGPQGAISLRMGLRVPFLAGVGKEGPNIQYQDVGTNLDCDAEPREDGRFSVHLLAERNSVYSPGQDRKPAEWRPGDQPLADKPVFSGVRSNVQLLMRDGQTVQSMTATDPVSGRVLKIDVTLNVVK